MNSSCIPSPLVSLAFDKPRYITGEMKFKIFHPVVRKKKNRNILGLTVHRFVRRKHMLLLIVFPYELKFNIKNSWLSNRAKELK